MRKADYAALAAIIKTDIDALKKAPDSASWARAKIVHDTARDIARQFVGRASVDRCEFLKACGIEE